MSEISHTLIIGHLADDVSITSVAHILEKN